MSGTENNVQMTGINVGVSTAGGTTQHPGFNFYREKIARYIEDATLSASLAGNPAPQYHDGLGKIDLSSTNVFAANEQIENSSNPSNPKVANISNPVNKFLNNGQNNGNHNVSAFYG